MAKNIIGDKVLAIKIPPDSFWLSGGMLILSLILFDFDGWTVNNCGHDNDGFSSGNAFLIFDTSHYFIKSLGIFVDNF